MCIKKEFWAKAKNLGKANIFIIHRGTQLNDKQSRVILPPTGEIDTRHVENWRPAYWGHNPSHLKSAQFCFVSLGGWMFLSLLLCSSGEVLKCVYCTLCPPLVSSPPLVLCTRTKAMKNSKYSNGDTCPGGKCLRWDFPSLKKILLLPIISLGQEMNRNLPKETQKKWQLS